MSLEAPVMRAVPFAGDVLTLLLVELILPGESLIALLLWLYNHRPARA